MKPPQKKISLFLLVLLVISAIDSIRNLPASSLFGSSLIFFFAFSAVFFLIPISLVSAELSAKIPDKGGVYHWMTKAFGEKVGMLSIWLQWINTMVWYPTILSFIAGTAAYLISPELAEHKFYLLSVILGTFWLLTFVNLLGVELSAKINSFCGLIGTMFPMALLILLGFYWLFTGNPIQISFDMDSMLPSFDSGSNWVSLTAIIASFLGIELSGVHINDIQDPQRNFPKAMGFSAFILIFTMLFGSLAIAFVLPAKEINLVAGVMQVFSNFFEHFNISWATAPLACLILIGSLGSIINWLISPAKGLLHAAEYGFLPTLFTKKNRYGVAYNVLLMQAIVVSLFCLIFFLVPSVNAFYWFLTGLSTDLYVILYILMLLSALKLRRRSGKKKSFEVPGRAFGLYVIVLLGFVGCLITLAVGFFPPEHIDVSIGKYALYILIGNISMILPVFLFYFYRSNRRRKMKVSIDDSIKDTKGRPIGS